MDIVLVLITGDLGNDEIDEQDDELSESSELKITLYKHKNINH